jgi:hypothetical protein
VCTFRKTGTIDPSECLRLSTSQSNLVVEVAVGSEATPKTSKERSRTGTLLPLGVGLAAFIAWRRFRRPVTTCQCAIARQSDRVPTGQAADLSVLRKFSMKRRRVIMSSKTTKAVLLTGLFLLVAGLAEAVPPGPPFDPPGPPPWRVKRVRSVPIPATLLPFGIGLLALPWLYSKRKK